MIWHPRTAKGQEPPIFVAKCSYWQRGGLNTLTNQWLCLCEVLAAADAGPHALRFCDLHCSFRHRITKTTRYTKP